MENIRKHGDIKLVTMERRRNYLVSEPSFHTTKSFTENLLAIGMRKTEILIYLFILFILYLKLTKKYNKIFFIVK